MSTFFSFLMATITGVLAYVLKYSPPDTTEPLPFLDEIALGSGGLALLFGVAFLAQLVASKSSFTYRVVSLQWAICTGLVALLGFKGFSYCYTPLKALSVEGVATQGEVVKVSTHQHRVRGIPFKSKSATVRYDGGQLQLGGEWKRGASVALLVAPSDRSVASPGKPGDSALSLLYQRYGVVGSFFLLVLPSILALASVGLMWAFLTGPPAEILPTPKSGNSAGLINCRSCQQSIPADSKFCPQCGAKGAGLVCVSCSQPVGPSDRFCKECGEAVASPEPQPASIQEPSARPPRPYSIKFGQARSKLPKLNKQVLLSLVAIFLSFALGFTTYLVSHDSDPVIYSPEQEIERGIEF